MSLHLRLNWTANYFIQALFMLTTWEISRWRANKLKNTTFIRSGVINTGLNPMQKTWDEALPQLITSYFLPNTLKAFYSYSFCSHIPLSFHRSTYTPDAYLWLYICVGLRDYHEGQGSGVHMACPCLSMQRTVYNQCVEGCALTSLQCYNFTVLRLHSVFVFCFCCYFFNMSVQELILFN